MSAFALVVWIAIWVVIAKIFSYYSKSKINCIGGSLIVMAVLFAIVAKAFSSFENHKKSELAEYSGFENFEEFTQAKQKGLGTKPQLDAYKEEDKRNLAEQKKQKKAEKEAECKKDLQCWGDRNSISAAVACDARIEKISKFDFKWTDGVFG